MPINGYCWLFLGGLDGSGAGGSHAVAKGTKVSYVFTERAKLGE